MDDWARIRYLHQVEKKSRRAIAAEMGVARKTVARALASSEPPSYAPRPPVNSAWSRSEPAVRALLRAHPSMPATVLAERVGWTGSITWFRQNVSRLRPEYRPADPVDHLLHNPGEQVQCDLWFPAVDIPVAGGSARFPVLVMVACHSRFVTAMMLPSRRTPDLLAGMWELLSGQLGSVPRSLLWDNEAGIGRGGRLAEGVSGFCGVLATRLIQAPPRDPETKGIVERANRYLETSFLPGRDFTGPEDFNDQLAQWLEKRANRRVVRAIKARPVEAVEHDRAAMGALPPVPPATAQRFTIRLSRSYYIRAASCDYSVDPTMIDRLVQVEVTLNQVNIRHQGQLVGAHRRQWARGLVVTDPAHVEIAASLRKAFKSGRSAPSDQNWDRDLSYYDQACGIDPAAIEGQVA